MQREKLQATATATLRPSTSVSSVTTLSGRLPSTAATPQTIDLLREAEDKNRTKHLRREAYAAEQKAIQQRLKQTKTGVYTRKVIGTETAQGPAKAWLRQIHDVNDVQYVRGKLHACPSDKCPVFFNGQGVLKDQIGQSILI